ncbi:MAG TPA: hypothetical protein VFY71_10595 [Planctomycetota bacterium]|nr:hypothetical protein [Planctomycetota bacterium]
MLVLDFLEILRRKRTLQQRSRASSGWMHPKNRAQLQIPTFMKH